MTAGPAVKQLTMRGELPAGMGTVERSATILERRMQRNGHFFSSASVKGRLPLPWQLVSFLCIVFKASFNSNVKRIYQQYFTSINNAKIFKITFYFILNFKFQNAYTF